MSEVKFDAFKPIKASDKKLDSQSKWGSPIKSKL